MSNPARLSVEVSHSDSEETYQLATSHSPSLAQSPPTLPDSISSVLTTVQLDQAHRRKSMFKEHQVVPHIITTNPNNVEMNNDVSHLPQVMLRENGPKSKSNSGHSDDSKVIEEHVSVKKLLYVTLAITILNILMMWKEPKVVKVINGNMIYNNYHGVTTCKKVDQWLPYLPCWASRENEASANKTKFRESVSQGPLSLPKSPDLSNTKAAVDQELPNLPCRPQLYEASANKTKFTESVSVGAISLPKSLNFSNTTAAVDQERPNLPCPPQESEASVKNSKSRTLVSQGALSLQKWKDLSNSTVLFDIPDMLQRQNDISKCTALQEKRTPTVRMSTSLAKMEKCLMEEMITCPKDSFPNNNQSIVPSSEGQSVLYNSSSNKDYCEWMKTLSLPLPRTVHKTKTANIRKSSAVPIVLIQHSALLNLRNKIQRDFKSVVVQALNTSQFKRQHQEFCEQQQAKDLIKSVMTQDFTSLSMQGDSASKPSMKSVKGAGLINVDLGLGMLDGPVSSLIQISAHLTTVFLTIIGFIAFVSCRWYNLKGKGNLSAVKISFQQIGINTACMMEKLKDKFMTFLFDLRPGKLGLIIHCMMYCSGGQIGVAESTDSGVPDSGSLHCLSADEQEDLKQRLQRRELMRTWNKSPEGYEPQDERKILPKLDPDNTTPAHVDSTDIHEVDDRDNDNDSSIHWPLNNCGTQDFAKPPSISAPMSVISSKKNIRINEKDTWEEFEKDSLDDSRNPDLCNGSEDKRNSISGNNSMTFQTMLQNDRTSDWSANIGGVDMIVDKILDGPTSVKFCLDNSGQEIENLTHQTSRPPDEKPRVRISDDPTTVSSGQSKVAAHRNITEAVASTVHDSTTVELSNREEPNADRGKIIEDAETANPDLCETPELEINGNMPCNSDFGIVQRGNQDKITTVLPVYSAGPNRVTDRIEEEATAITVFGCTTNQQENQDDLTFVPANSEDVDAVKLKISDQSSIASSNLEDVFEHNGSMLATVQVVCHQDVTVIKESVEVPDNPTKSNPDFFGQAAKTTASKITTDIHEDSNTFKSSSSDEQTSIPQGNIDDSTSESECQTDTVQISDDVASTGLLYSAVDEHNPVPNSEDSDEGSNPQGGLEAGFGAETGVDVGSCPDTSTDHPGDSGTGSDVEADAVVSGPEIGSVAGAEVFLAEDVIEMHGTRSGACPEGIDANAINLHCVNTSTTNGGNPVCQENACVPVRGNLLPLLEAVKERGDSYEIMNIEPSHQEYSHKHLMDLQPMYIWNRSEFVHGRIPDVMNFLLGIVSAPNLSGVFLQSLSYPVGFVRVLSESRRLFVDERGETSFIEHQFELEVFLRRKQAYEIYISHQDESFGSLKIYGVTKSIKPNGWHYVNLIYQARAIIEFITVFVVYKPPGREETERQAFRIRKGRSVKSVLTHPPIDAMVMYLKRKYQALRPDYCTRLILLGCQALASPKWVLNHTCILELIPTLNQGR